MPWWTSKVRRAGAFGSIAALLIAGLVAVAAVHAERPRAAAAVASPTPAVPHAVGPAAEVARPSDPPAARATPPACSNLSELAHWPLARLASQVLMLSVGEDDIASVTPLIRDGVGGMLITGTSGVPGLAQSLASLRGVAGPVPPLFAVDAEGGRVQRLGPLLPPLASPRQLAATRTPGEVRDDGQRLGTALHELGITMDFAPDADLTDGPAGGPIGDRSFSNDADVTATYAGAFAQGLEAAGVVPVAKHFPGHGHADGDTDLAPAVTPPIERLRTSDLRSFTTLIAHGIPAVMVGHLTVPGVTDAGRPASVSPAAIGLLRRGLGFGGLIVTDSLSMGAISRSGLSVPDAAVAALEAGADLLLFTSNQDAPDAVGAIGRAVTSGALPMARLQDAAARVLAIKHVDLCRAARQP